MSDAFEPFERPAQFLYVSDRRDKFLVSDMETSHLVNVIGHHFNQIQTLEGVYDNHPYPTLRDRIRMLEEVIDVLVEELIHREVRDDEYITLLEPAD